jgi:hypothetical protein
MITTLLFLAAVASVDSDPLARARSGEAQCLSPDVLFKTCVSLEHYFATGPGTYINRGENLVDYNRPIVMETSVPVQVKGRAVCGTVRSAYVLGGKVSVAGRPLPREQAAAHLARFNKRLSSILGKEACSVYEPTDGGMYKIKATIAGVRRPELDSVFKWVKPSDGYTVAP